MENTEQTVEWFEGNDPGIDFNELNKTANITRYANTNNNNIDYTDIKASVAFEKLKPEYDNNFRLNFDAKLTPSNLNQTETTVTVDDENPVIKFDKLKAEIDLIEKDLKFYSQNTELFKENYPLERSFNELRNLKLVSDYIFSSENYRIMNEIKNKNIKMEKESYNLLNQRIYEKLNQHLLNKVKIINRLKCDNIEKYDNVEYELYLTPDTMKVKLFTKLIEIKRSMQNMELKIGKWDVKSKRQSISEVVNNIKNHLRLFDKEYQKEIQTKMEALNSRLKEINEGKEEFYQNINKQRLDELYKGFGSSKQVEDLIFKTVTKMESLENNHEESAYIFLKLKEMCEQLDKVSLSIEENSEILTNLKDNINENVKSMQKNISNLKERLNKLKK